MILRFRSGSATPASFLRNRSCCVDQLNVHAELCVIIVHNLFGFVFPEQAMVDENTVKLIAYGFVNQNSSYRGIYTAGKGTENFFVPHLLLDFGNIRSARELMSQSPLQPQMW